MEWIALNSKSQVDEFSTLPQGQKVLIFKHSTRCGISRMVLKQFVSDFESEDIIPYMLDLLNHREVSNYIAETFNVRHESPQILIIENGAVIHHSSHHAISANNI